VRRPPSLARFPRYPIVAVTALAACTVTLAYFSRPGRIDAFAMDARVFHGEPWRLVTSALPHGDAFHLLFNLYWLWALGTALEDRFGHLRTLLLFVALAVVSAAAEFALFTGGIGLSGIGYGLFGTAWMLSRHERALADLVDRRTIEVFIGWGILCIVTTVAGVFPVANAAHGAGLALGVLVGLAVARGARYWGAVAGLVAVTGLAATVGRPGVSLARAHAAEDLAYRSGQLAQAGRTGDAVRLMKEALRFSGRGDYWAYLGELERQSRHTTEARVAFRAGCDRGDAAACGNLGIMLETASGGPFNRAEALALYRKACDLGSRESCQNRDRFNPPAPLPDSSADGEP